MRPARKLGTVRTIMFLLAGEILRRTARHKHPHRIEIVDELPKSAIGKNQKRKIRDTYWRGCGCKI
jgi:acyl-CoA synthetase (AMP-forming)/AMP-acid ligase II